MFKEIVDSISGLAKNIFPFVDELNVSDEEKEELKIKMQSMLTGHSEEMYKTYYKEIENRTEVIKAEMKQDDAYTKRARPTVMYFFIGIITLNYCLYPIICHIFGTTLPTIKLPSEAWDAFKIVFGVYAVGRSFEKTDVINKLASTIKKTTKAYTGDSK